MARIDLDTVRSPDYARNLDKYGDNENCLLCGKPMTKGGKVSYVWLTTSGHLADECEELTSQQDQGLFPVGLSCGKKLPKGFLFVLDKPA